MINKDMKVKWERNTRVLDLIRSGKIDHEDMIPKTSTDNFPEEAATVRLSNVRAKKPFVTVHIKGKNKPQTNQYHSWNYATTMRVNMGGDYCDWQGVNGELDSEFTFENVHNAVTKVKEVMGL